MTALTEDVDITLENLLSLALGNPEVGAVNFNFLHEVISEILKHLGISKKISRITQEIDYRVIEASQSDPRHYIDQRRSTEPQYSVEAKKKVSAESLIEVSHSSSITASAVNNNSNTKDPETSKEEQQKHEKSDTGGVPETEKPVNSDANDIETIHEGTTLSVKEKKSSSHVPVTPPSRKSSYVHPRRSSYVTQRLSIKPSDSHHNDVAIVSRSIDRRDSKTPAGDMWHVLNINRRVEAAEAAIQGITNLIDTINSELDDLKISKNKESPVTNNNEENTISKQEQEVVKKMTAKLNGHDGKIAEIEKKILKINPDLGKAIQNETLENYCTSEQVQAMIDSSLENHIPQFELPFKSDESTNEEKTCAKVSDKDLTSKESKESKESVSKESKTSICLKESKGSRTKIVYQEISNKMLFLEKEINKAKERMKHLDKELTAKMEQSTDDKASKAEVAESLAKLRNEMTLMQEHINALEKSHKAVLEDVQCLTARNDEFATQQKNLSNTLRKMERNVEDMTDNFHRTQSEFVRSQQNISVTDDAAITKIRSTIFDFQEQHTKFQNQIDSLLQDSKVKSETIDELTEKISHLQVHKADETYILDVIHAKADRHLVEDKVNREQLDTYVGEIDRNIQDVLQKIDVARALSNKNLTHFQKLIDEKLNRDELDKIRTYIDVRFKNFKPKIPQIQSTEDNAAATRKKLIPNCNCISCDRPIDLPITDPGASLPCYQSLPGVKTIRPFTTFDLQAIRQHMQQTWLQSGKEIANERDKLQKELLKLCGVRDLDELVAQTNRACGGSHTLIEQNRRNPTKPPMFYREEHTPFQPGERQLFEMDVLGRDGHIYKGRIHTPTLPEIPRKGTQKEVTCDAVPRPQRISSPIIPRPSVQKSGSIHGGTPNVASNGPIHVTAHISKPVHAE